jgi:hypothetical protein
MNTVIFAYNILRSAFCPFLSLCSKLTTSLEKTMENLSCNKAEGKMWAHVWSHLEAVSSFNLKMNFGVP